MTMHEDTIEQGSREHRTRRPAERMAPGDRTPQRALRLRAVLLAGAATALLAGSAAGQLPAKSLDNLKIAPATSFTFTAKAGEGGKIAPAGSVIVRAGATQQFAIAANSGWEVLSVTGCNGTRVNTAGGVTYTTGRVAASCNVLASFVHQVPKLTSFKINNGAAQTLTRSVTVAYTAAPGPLYPAATSYRLSMRADFLGAEWKTTSGTASGIAHELEPGPGTKTLHFQLRSANGRVSEVLSDSIDLAQRQSYTVTGREFYDAALEAGFGTRWTYRATGVDCLLIPGPADGIAANEVAARASGPGAGGDGPRCRFDFFSGAVLRNGFLFGAIGEIKSPECYTYRRGGPAPGGTSVNYQVELFGSATECQYRLTAVSLEGPPNRSWREAFGPEVKP